MMGTKELYEKARPVLDRVLLGTRERQAAIVAEECGADEQLAGLVRSLLRQRDHVAEGDGSVDALSILSVSINDEQPPDALGSYRIIRRLGAGGMSVVYLAEQSNPRRLVALKVLRGQALKREVLQHEVETLAMLRHPGIGQIYEAGIACTPDGDRPFFVMEFVSSNGDTTCEQTGARAETLLEYAAGRPCWGIRNRLEMIAAICDALDYAHKRGVIHRDLKPANVLVDHLGQPKVIDFGIAMLANSAPGEESGPLAKTIAGTLPYMSPEQLAGDSTRIDVRSDVYALGAMAFQLLSGELPLDGLTGKRESDPTVLRDKEPRALASNTWKFPRDVREIVAKALAENQNTRYQSAAELAADIRCFLATKPVSARRSTLAYRGRCLIRRRPTITATAMVAGILISVASLRAYRANAGALDALSLLENGLLEVDPISDDGTPATLNRMLDSVSAEIDKRPNLHRAAAGQIHVVLGSLYFRLDPRSGSTTVKAAAHYRKAAELLEREYGPADQRTIQAKNNLAMALSKSGDPAQAAKILEELIPLRERSGDRQGALVTRGNHAVALLRLGGLEAAMEEFSRVVTGFVELGDKYEAMKGVVWQCRVLMEVGYLADAESIQREALKRSLAEGDMFNDVTFTIMDGLTANLIRQRRWEEARAELAQMRAFTKKKAAAEHTIHREVLSRMLIVCRELGDKSGYYDSREELDAWEEKYGHSS